ncbi:MAG: sulfur transferase domain-containing protein [Gemmatimonadetes bacterium]|nr:sulfur transferase domain-containing protein [Gemmatimonadota bacterium]
MTRTTACRWMFAAVLVTALPYASAAQRLAGPNPSGPVPAPVNLDTTGLFVTKFVKVGDDVFMGGQPTERALRELRAQGVTTIVNLRAPDEMTGVKFDEVALVSELGMKYVYIPLRGTAEYPYTPSALTEFSAAMSAADGKILLHCASAARASQLWAAYLIQERGMQAATVVEQVRQVDLMMSTGRPGVKQALEEFLGREVPELKQHPRKP